MEKKLPTPDERKLEVNYLYFTFFFAVLILTSGSSILLKESLSGSRLFFFLYATGQAALETAFFVFLCTLIPRYLGKIASLAFIGLTFLFLLLHVIDFLVDRILDLTVWETLVCFILDESIGRFFYLLDASGIPLWIWAFAFLAILAIPFLGIALYQTTHTITLKRPILIRKEWIVQSFICIPVALLFWDVTASRVIHPDSYTCFIKSLPWKWTFLQPESIHFPLTASFAPLASEEEIQQHLERYPVVLKSRPNIYLFVIESLREDCITSEVAPHLDQFKKKYNHFDLALSNGNGSHLSWFSIFYSQFPYSWNEPLMKDWKKGSPALQLLKNWGYKIRLYSSAQLNYYDMERILFGKEEGLIDSYQTFHHTPSLSAAQTDRAALEKLEMDLSENPDLQEGQCIIVFLDSTHFHYTWPTDFAPPFTPYSNEVSYFHLFQSSRKIEEIKNRYKNSIAYVDSLFGKFEASQNLSDAIVVITGDHGEEFFEHGHLFHGSHLTREQTNVPLYIKLGKIKMKNPPAIVSQIDIFPTILHYLGGSPISFLKGKAIFDPTHSPYAISARFNGGKAPREFCIQNKTTKLIAQFENHKDILASKSLKIRSIRDPYDQMLIETPENLGEWIQEEFGPAINQLLEKTSALNSLITPQSLPVLPFSLEPPPFDLE